VLVLEPKQYIATVRRRANREIGFIQVLVGVSKVVMADARAIATDKEDTLCAPLKLEADGGRKPLPQVAIALGYESRGSAKPGL
jgi:hypothetical protein